MRTRCLVSVIGSMLLESVLAIHAAPQRITVPAHLEYCVTSRSLDAKAYELPEVRSELFDSLYRQIEQAALDAGLPSMGVPFVDAVTSTTHPTTVPPAGASVGAPAPAVTYVVRECAIVPSRGAPALQSPGLREVAERSVYATLCVHGSIEACKRELEKIVRQDNASPADLARPIIWRTRPALAADSSVANLVASMSDSGLRVLKDGPPKTPISSEFAVVSAELAPSIP